MVEGKLVKPLLFAIVIWDPEIATSEGENGEATEFLIASWSKQTIPALLTVTWMYTPLGEVIVLKYQPTSQLK